ncbi:hypothetical protein [Burkholderia sp. PAMC 28687]|uniref:hypothetical protein n=1 Tax=Burkholderia sp. PAMC 28687 TaxID=1795874 RepID=UPI000AF852FA|nr:hypothetical protein [Burkholderia sp. PAMC 28687]
MPFHDYWTTQPYDYDRATRGLAEKLQRFMEMADEQEDESVAAGIRGTALQIYERWYHFSVESGTLKSADDAKFIAILNG